MSTVVHMESTTGNYGATQCAFIPELLNVPAESLNLTTDVIFQQTPQVDQVINSCSYRLNEENANSSNISLIAKKLVMVTESNGTLCRDHFKVQKYMSSNWMCYRVTPIKSEVERVLSSLNFVKFMFVLFFNSSISTKQIIYILSTQLPRASQSMARNIEMGKSSDVWFKVSYLKFVEETLPYPYDLGLYGGFVYSVCYSNCMKVSLGKIGLIPPESVVMYPSNSSRLITASDYENEFVRKHLIQSESKCNQSCRLLPSYQIRLSHSYTVTDMTANVRMPIPNGSASIWARITDYNITRVVFHPKFTLTQLLVSLGNIFATWFGLSVINLNPVIHLKLADSAIFGNGDINQTVGELCSKIDAVSLSFSNLLAILRSLRAKRSFQLYK